MKTPTLKEGIVIALAASTIGSISYFVLAGLFSDGFVIRSLVSSFSLGYILYLFSRNKERIGRATTLLMWFAITSGLWLSWAGISFFILAHLLLIWLVRSLYFYSSLFSSLVDLALSGFSLGSAVWALAYTGSIFLSLWCFFLVQALFVFIPARIGKKQAKSATRETNSDADFQRAYREAEAAVRKLSTH